MKITLEDVRHVALLARLELSPDEQRLFVGQLDAILGYVDQLNELDTAGVPPTSHVVEMKTPFRDDRVDNGPDVENLLANAPDRSGAFFRVPKIIE